MASDQAEPGRWRELLDAGDPSLVEVLRASDDAEALASFAATWFEDARPASRRLLMDYLDQPLNAYRHEGLIKRLFKQAEAAGDDPVMARFLVLFDRSVRRVQSRYLKFKHQGVGSRSEAEALRDAWEGQGMIRLGIVPVPGRPEGRHSVIGMLAYQVLVHRRKTDMPRGRIVENHRGRPAPDWAVRYRIDWHGSPEKPEPRHWPVVMARFPTLRLFSLATRHYLRRRAWRYFRRLGRNHPDRYVAAISEALVLYRDEDVADSLALLDNWGMVHALFHHSEVLKARPDGWNVASGRSMAELAPAPIFEPLWAGATGPVVNLMVKGRSRTVVRWAVRRLRGDLAGARGAYPLEGWLTLLGHDDPEVAGLAADVLQGAEGLNDLDLDRWLALLESSSPAALEVVCALAERYVRPEDVTLGQALKLAVAGPLPLARLGFKWLQAGPRAGDDPAMFEILEARCRPLRPELLRWLRGKLAPSGRSVLEFLDSRHADARSEGWDWFRSVPEVFNDSETWRKLLESPHDDVRLALVAELEARADRELESGSILGLWASVLLNVHRGSRARPSVVRQVVRRLEARPEEASRLLPLLGVALRSVRGPERRTGLVAVVQLLERRSEVEPLVRSAFPELQWDGWDAIMPPVG